MWTSQRLVAMFARSLNRRQSEGEIPMDVERIRNTERDIFTRGILCLSPSTEEHSQLDICRRASVHLDTHQANQLNLHNSNYQCSGYFEEHARLPSIIPLISGIVRRIEIVREPALSHHQSRPCVQNPSYEIVSRKIVRRRRRIKSTWRV